MNPGNTDFTNVAIFCCCLLLGQKFISMPNRPAWFLHLLFTKEILININILVSQCSSLHWIIRKRHALHIYLWVSGVFEWLDNSTK